MGPIFEPQILKNGGMFRDPGRTSPSKSEVRTSPGYGSTTYGEYGYNWNGPKDIYIYFMILCSVHAD